MNRVQHLKFKFNKKNVIWTQMVDIIFDIYILFIVFINMGKYIEHYFFCLKKQKISFYFIYLLLRYLSVIHIQVYTINYFEYFIN